MSQEKPAFTMPSVRRESLSTRVKEAIREMIIANNLKPGDELPPEGEIAVQLGVSRTSVREAVRSLEALGVLQVRHGHGILVKGFDFDALMDSLYFSLAVMGLQVEELLEVREGLEIAFLPAVLANVTQDDKEKLEAIVSRMKENAARGMASPADDQEFHLILYRPAGNELLLRLVKIFWIAVRRLQLAPGSQVWSIDPEVVSRDHEAILEALKLADIALLQRRIREHYKPIRRNLAQAALARQEEAVEDMSG